MVVGAEEAVAAMVVAEAAVATAAVAAEAVADTAIVIDRQRMTLEQLQINSNGQTCEIRVWPFPLQRAYRRPRLAALSYNRR